MKVTSGYPVLDNRPIDQWKVTELKEELKKRKLITRGLKDELVRRLDEDIRKGMEAEKQEADDNGVEEVVADDTAEVVKSVETTGFETNGLGLGNSKDVEENVVDAVKTVETTGFETGWLVLGNSEDVEGNVGDAKDGIIKLDDDVSRQVEIKDSIEQPVEGKKVDQQLDFSRDQVLEEGTLAMENVPSNDLGNNFGENFPSQKAGGGEQLYQGIMGITDVGSKAHEQSQDVKLLHEDGKLDSFNSNNQVSEVSSSLGFPVKSNSISTDNVSFNEKNELKDKIITDNVNLEFDIKPEMVQPSSSDLVPNSGESHPSDVDEPLQNKVSVQDTDNNDTNAEVSQKNYSADFGSEKLNLDRSSGDDSMEEDALESKHIDSYEEVVEKTDKNEVATIKDEIPIATMDIDIPGKEKGTQNEKSILADASTDKRKLSDQEAVLNNEPTKRQRRWKSESNSFKESQISNIPPQSAVKDVPQPPVLKRNLSGPKPAGGVDEPPKVPPSLKPATNSLRIDRFLRPFTLKAVQELLGKTGTVTSFWMDHIKTHCYVTYSSVEEAENTRNAVYNLQWPPNGGRHLVAEFVNPDEVKACLEPPPPSPAAPVSSGPMVPEPPSMPQPSPRLLSLKQRMTQQPTLPPPPPLTKPPQAREQAFPPPPPPQHEKVEAPIVTLDDLFRKTKATPRIYYLPLSEEQVEARRRNSTKQ